MDMDPQRLEEMYRLTRENNRLLHSMRRNALVGGIIKFIVYAALVLGPLWFYYQYMGPVVEQMLHTMQQIQGTSTQAQTQFGQFQDIWQKFQQQFKGAAQ